MKCPHCKYEPRINEFDYCDSPGRFFELGVEMKQEQNEHSRHETAREAVHGCPDCGALFINMRCDK